MNDTQSQRNIKSLADLGSALKKTHQFPRKSYKNPVTSPMKLGLDGVDHINTWEGAETLIGQFLSHNYHHKFHHNLFGRFDSIEAFWYYIRSEERDDGIRSMSGKTLKEFIDKLNLNRVTNFRAIIMDTQYQRIKQFKDIVEEIKTSVLPYDCYYINSKSNLRTRPGFFRWIMEGHEEIRKALKENREPDFGFLLDQKNSGIYDFVITKLPSSVEELKVSDMGKTPEACNDSNDLSEELVNDSIGNKA